LTFLLLLLRRLFLDHLSIFFSGSLIFWEFSFFEIPIYSGYLSLVGCIAGKDFLSFCRHPLQFKDHFFCCVEAF
jgi:hypothetical protein